MGKCKTKITDRIFAMVLALITVVYLMPTTVFAANESNPEAFTINVKDSKGIAVSDATVAYVVKDNSSVVETGNSQTDADGYVVVTELANHTDAITNGTITISYSIAKSGYTTKQADDVQVSDAKGNIDVVLYATPPATVNLSVVKSGSGTVKINGDESTSVTVKKEDAITLEVTPVDVDGGKAYIKSLTIGTESIPVEKYKAYSNNALKISKDTQIVVEFGIDYTITASAGSGGVILLNNNKVNSITVDKDALVSVSVTPDSGYEISGVVIDGVPQTVSNVSNFTENVAVSKNVIVSATFIKLYTIMVTYDNAKGTVVTDPACVGGQVTVKEGNKIKVTATPNPNYRVSKVVKTSIKNGEKNSETKDYTDNGKSYEDTITTIKEDYSYEITFASNVYKVTANQPTNGTVVIKNANVDYGGSTEVTFTPDSGYVLEAVTVDGKNVLEDVTVDGEKLVDVKQVDNDSIQFTFKNIIADKNIVVSFKEMPIVDMTDVSFNSSDVARVNSNGDLYVFKKGSTVKFSTAKNGMRVNGQKEGILTETSTWSTTTNTTIEKLEIFYKGEFDYCATWHKVKLPDGGLKLAIDQTAPSVKLTPDEANSYGYYNKDVNVAIAAIDPGSYSGIATVEYWVKYGVGENAVETQHNTINVNKESAYNGNIVVDASKNNRDDIQVIVAVTDASGNTTTATQNLKINITKPVVSISIDGTLHPEAKTGYYNSDRTATITIVDRASCFNEKTALDGLSITAKDKEGNYVVPQLSKWSGSEDTHTATLTFSSDANYKWQLSYTNNADLTNDAASTTGDSVYEFVVDKTAPVGSIALETTTWNKLLSTITFGIWKNYSVSAKATGTDVTSPVYDIKYYKSNTTTALTKEELTALYDSGKFVSEKYTVDSDEQFAVYARITDYAGNTLYVSTNGIIVDMTESEITLTPDAPNKNGLYNKDVDVAVKVNDGVVDGKAYSGIKTIDYTVENNGTVTQSGNLYTFDKTNPTQDELKKDWSGSIKVDKVLNNDDHIKVTVISYDNAGEKSEKSIPLSINTDEPVVNVSYSDTANKVAEDNGYFGANRAATIQITDRSSAFDVDTATKGIVISAIDGKKNKVKLDTSSMISNWSSTGNVHTATITFSDDGNYTWSFDYTNRADNHMKPVNATGTTPFKFTVDKTDPTGTVSVGTSIWSKLLSVLTFGLYSNEDVQVKATSDDATSPVTVEYYKTSNPTAMTAEELDSKSFEPYKDFTVAADEQFVVYLKITDHAGNYIYINSDGYIVDKVKSDITITPDVPNKNGTYKDDVNVAIKVSDAAPYSGIKTVDYWVVKDNDAENPTQKGNLYTFSKINPTQAELLKDWTGSITVDSKKNNSCNVVVYVKTVDNAGNEDTKSIPLDIDVTAPSIKVTYDNNTDNNGNTYFNANRMATVVITERTHHFDADAATKGIVITAVNSKGNKVAIDPSAMISSWTTKEGATADAATHTANIKYQADANYTFAISYTDKADIGNSSVNTDTSVAPYKFTVDTNSPTGTVKAKSEEGREDTWNELIDSLKFGFWSGKKIALTGTSDDATSPIDSVVYYKTDSPKALTEAEVKTVTSWQNFDGFSVSANEQFTVYLKITDKAGNVSYISTDGMIVDDTSPREESIAPEITITPEKPINGLYNGDVKVSIKVDDPLVSGTYSGLKTVNYKVLNMGKETQSGTLYSFTNKNPSRDELLKTWTGDITVDSKKNNSNDVVVEIYAEDNALNSSKDKVAIKIDITAPTIDISYSNNDGDSGKYYKKDRVATVVVTERNFKAEDVKIAITNIDGKIPEISSWKEVLGSGNQDNTTHTATITYHEDGDYTFKIEYKDLADNKCAGENYAAGTTNPKEFTVDQTLPVVSVSYDNNNAQNDKYFKANRTATIVVKEHNFDVGRVKFTQTATKGGATIAVPSAAWSNNGDVHTATISYNADGDYTFDVKMQDMAGNESAEANYGTSVAAKDFTVDMDIKEPEITGVENGKAYKGDVIPVISFSDINYSNYEVKLTRTIMGEKDVDVTKEFMKTLSIDAQGGSGKNDTFAKEQKNDGIYTLYVKMLDKAGNESEKKVTFTVNRFGSVYEYSDYLRSLIANGGAYTQTLKNDLVITEYNPDRLVGDSLVIKITCDGKPLSQVKYNVSPVINEQVGVGNSGWFQYQYTISKENFAKDGVYKISIASKDATGNAPENTNYKDKSILFRVDNTVPELTSVVGLEKAIINAQKVTVKYTLFDTIGLKSVKVYVNGKQQGDTITDFSGDINNYSGSFVINESSSKQTVRLVVEDMAGNITDTDSENFKSAYKFEKAVTVSTNSFVRWYADKQLFWGSIGGILVFVAGIWYAIYNKRKKLTNKSDVEL
ncbi:hypothetical protein CFOLD11_40750 [Clostridium folliculivorans]|uniref:Bacterial repeat domain-containing protein n=1 Tax=Clostridium folliculivorans TaxID=2886038 RepID=A0A9W5Y681_9CLOT|nr:hypothetical protein [Clostridium folliculivorans]GKU27248.1 hypothetical protein CFOLD11_40750 [Clostridium folliculivorans]